VGELSTGLDVPEAPVITATAVSSTIIRIAWAWSANAASYEIEQSATGTGSWSNIATVTAGNYYDKGSLTASTKYYYRARGVNATGNGDYSTTVNETTKATEAFLTRIESRLTDYLASATQGAGYWFTWKYTTQRDIALSPCSATVVTSWVDLSPVEDSVDAAAQADFNGYHNKIKAVIHAVVLNSTQSTNPKEAYKKLCAKMLEDIKKMLGSNLNSATVAASTAFWNEVASVDYVGSEIEWNDASSDILKPGKLKATYEIGYVQRRTNPNISAI
jgi:hypothetical protein